MPFCMDKETSVDRLEKRTEHPRDDTLQASRFQFGFRAWLILNVALAIPLGLITNRKREAEREHRIVAQIRAKTHRVGASSGVSWNIREDAMTAMLMRMGGTFPTYYKERVEQLELANTTDDDLQMVRRLLHLEELDIHNAQITGEGVATLEQMDSLRVLRIHGDFPDTLDERLQKSWPWYNHLPERADPDNGDRKEELFYFHK